MKEYIVAQGSPGRLINVKTGQERAFSLREDKTFQEDDVVFDPASIYASSGAVTCEFGFRSGTSEQRSKFVWVVDGQYVEEQSDDPEF